MTRKAPRRSWLAGLALAAVAVLILAAPGWADTETETATDVETETETYTGWRLRFQAASIDFDNDSGPVGQGGSFDMDVGGGVGANAEYRFNRRLGIDLGVLAGAGVDMSVRAVHAGGATVLVHDTLVFTPWTVGLDVHLTPDSRVDLYFCPMLAWIHYGGLFAHAGSAGVVVAGIDIDDDFAPGAGLGLGVPFGSQRRWSFNANLTYLDSELSGTGSAGYRVDDDHDLTMFGLGFGYRL